MGFEMSDKGRHIAVTPLRTGHERFFSSGSLLAVRVAALAPRHPLETWLLARPAPGFWLLNSCQSVKFVSTQPPEKICAKTGWSRFLLNRSCHTRG